MVERMKYRREARARAYRRLAGRHQLGDPPRSRSTKFAEKLRAGIDIGHSLGANFVLMNLQYVPAVVALPDEEEYARVMADVAKEKGVGLFRRFEIMRVLVQ